MTANDLIASSLRLINVLATGENPSIDESNDALLVLNQLIDSWNGESLMIFTQQRQVVVPLTLVQAYTLGPGGDFNVARPANIPRVSVLSLNNPVQPLELPLEMLTDEQWQNRIPVKNVTSALPTIVWDDGGFPLRTLSFFPIPSQQVNFVIYSWQALSQWTLLSDDHIFPPGYLKALRYCLAVDLAPEFGVQAPQTVTAQAQLERAKIKSLNTGFLDIQCDAALLSIGRGGQYNWLNDTGG